MKALLGLSLAVSFLALVALVATWALPPNYASRARLTQRVKPSDPELTALTGEVGTTIGPPELMIVDDPKAFLPGRAESGALLANDDYMREHGVYPLQLKSVEAVARYARLGSAVVLVLGVVGAWFARGRVRAQIRHLRSSRAPDGSV